MFLHDIKQPEGARKKKKIVGRGPGSGLGKTSGRGHKGQRSRAGRGILKSLEGGQSPLIRRMPKVGFNSKRPKVYQLVKLEDLTRLKEGSVVNAELLKSNGLIKSMRKPFKVLGNGEIQKALQVQAHCFSKSAEEKIVKAGGKASIIK